MDFLHFSLEPSTGFEKMMVVVFIRAKKKGEIAWQEAGKALTVLDVIKIPFKFKATAFCRFEIHLKNPPVKGAANIIHGVAMGELPLSQLRESFEMPLRKFHPGYMSGVANERKAGVIGKRGTLAIRAVKGNVCKFISWSVEVKTAHFVQSETYKLKLKKFVSPENKIKIASSETKGMMFKNRPIDQFIVGDNMKTPIEATFKSGTSFLNRIVGKATFTLDEVLYQGGNTGFKLFRDGKAGSIENSVGFLEVAISNFKEKMVSFADKLLFTGFKIKPVFLVDFSMSKVDNERNPLVLHQLDFGFLQNPFLKSIIDLHKHLQKNAMVDPKDLEVFGTGLTSHAGLFELSKDKGEEDLRMNYLRTIEPIWFDPNGRKKLCTETNLTPFLLQVSVELIKKARHNHYFIVCVHLRKDAVFTKSSEIIEVLFSLAKAPVSFIFVGVGPKDLPKNEFFKQIDKRLVDKQGNKAARDFVQYIGYDKLREKPVKFIKKAMSEINKQHLDYLNIID